MPEREKRHVLQQEFSIDIVEIGVPYLNHRTGYLPEQNPHRILLRARPHNARHIGVDAYAFRAHAPESGVQATFRNSGRAEQNSVLGELAHHLEAVHQVVGIFDLRRHSSFEAQSLRKERPAKPEIRGIERQIHHPALGVGMQAVVHQQRSAREGSGKAHVERPLFQTYTPEVQAHGVDIIGGSLNGSIESRHIPDFIGVEGPLGGKMQIVQLEIAAAPHSVDQGGGDPAPGARSGEWHADLRLEAA